jgi:hypothetical protein
VITWQARLATLAAALFPNLTARIVAACNRLLSSPTRQRSVALPGRECRSSFLPRLVTALADRASKELNEV